MNQFGIIDGPQFDYIQKGNPTIDVNPRTLYATWLNLETGELWICTENTKDKNSWRGNNGHKIGYYTLARSGANDSTSISGIPSGIVTDMCIADGRLVLTTSNDDGIVLYDDLKGTNPVGLSHGSYPTGCAFDGTDLLLADNYSTPYVRVCDGISNTTKATLYPGDPIWCLAVANGNILMGYSQDVRIYNGVSTDLDRTINVGMSVGSMCFDGTNIYVTDNGSTLKAFSLEDGSLVKTLTPLNNDADAVEYYDGRLYSQDAGTLFSYQNEDEP